MTWAKEYLEVEIENEIINKIVELQLLTEQMVLQLNPNRNLATLQEDLEEIGYPYDF